jgi:hypothetical protein
MVIGIIVARFGLLVLASIVRLIWRPIGSTVARRGPR